MKYLVNEDCIGCGLCQSICPEVFTLENDGIAKAKDIDVEDDVKSAAEEAMESCPVNAIEEK